MPNAKRSVQAPSSVIMIRPHHFHPNGETAADNAFQKVPGGNHSAIAEQARLECTQAAEALRDKGIVVHLFEDEGKSTPDAVFPNNWFSTHPGGHVATYPMFAQSRRAERRQDVLDMLKQKYRVQEVIDYSGLEQDNLFLEGTGAMVLDHLDRVAYAARSNRTDPIALERFCTHFNYEPMVFDAADSSGRPVYHTNVLMCVGTDFALVGLDMITSTERRREIVDRLEASGKQVIALSEKQIEGFAGNAIELQGNDGKILALSEKANAALNPAQKTTICKSCELLPLDVDTIEMAGGSVRCMIAGVHLTRR